MEKIAGGRSNFDDPRKHLHIRGENLPIDDDFAWLHGNTSTYVEKIFGSLALRCGGGNTSTYVEKMGERKNPDDSIEKHLHIRGENWNLVKQSFSSVETPPHTWRK